MIIHHHHQHYYCYVRTYIYIYIYTIMKHIAWPKIIHHPLWLLNPSKPGRDFMTVGLLEPGENSVDESLLAGEVILSDAQRVNPEQSAVVPKGCFAVYVGPELRRFVIPMRCLSTPDFRVLMDRVAEEYGFEQEGALKIPCDEQHFQHILVRSLGNKKKDIKKQRRFN